MGYRIGQGDHIDSKDSLITFVTVGYMLQYLSHNPSAMLRFTHVVLDEVHERSMDMDLLNLLIKKLMQLQQNAPTKLVVMSATLQSGLFGEYFTPQHQTVQPALFVGVRRFPVQAIYLEQLLQTLPSLRNTCGSAVSKAVNAFESAARVHQQGKDVASSMGMGGSLVKPEVSPELRKVICEAVWKMAQPDSCILIFLPGIGEIGALQDDLEGSSSQVPLQVLVLHSLVPKEEQDLAMAPALAAHCKIILSTNIAESSITIPDVRVVLDTGLHRGIFYDDKRRMPSLLCTWCSQSSGKQRAGRAGRVAPGTIFYLFTKAFHEHVMPAFDEAEITRVPLEKTVLRVKLLLSSFGSTTQLLSQSLTPPPPERVVLAIKALYDVGAFTSDDEEAEVSELGRLAADMPVDLPLVKLILLGRAFGCLADSIVMAASLSLQDVFLMPSSIFVRDQRQYLEDLAQNFKWRMKYDNGSFSEPLMYLACYQDWLGSEKKFTFSRSRSLSHSRMAQLDMLIADLSNKVQGLLSDSPTDSQHHTQVSRLLASARRRGHCEAGELKGLFQKDANLLRFVMAGACAPIFLHGAIKQSTSGEITKAGLTGWRTLTMTKLPKDANNEQTLGAALQAANIRIKKFNKAAADKALVEFALDERSFDAVLDAAEQGKGVAPIVSDMCFGCKMLYQLYVSSKHKVALPNPNYRPGSALPPEVTIGSINIDRLVTWQLGTTGVQVLPYWRSPISTVSDFSGISSHRFGVALSLLGTENDMKVRALGITILPQGPFSKVLQIVFTPPAQPISLLCNQELSAFYSIQIGTSMVAFEPCVFSRQDMAFINKVRRTVSLAIAGTLGGSSEAGGKARGGAAGKHRRQEATSHSASREQASSGSKSVDDMLRELMALLMRRDLTQEEKDEERAFEGGGVHGMQPGRPAARGKEKLQWVKCRFEQGSMDYLPQVILGEAAPSGKAGAAEAQGGGDAGAGAAPACKPAEIPPGYVGISLLCSHDFNVASQMPAGMYMTSREECESGRHAWYEICCRSFSAKPMEFKNQVRDLLKWFKGATSFDRNAVLEFPPIFESAQRREMHEVGNKMGLAHHSSGPKSERRLMVCSNLDAIKNIQKRGGVSAVATAGAASVQAGISTKAQLQQHKAASLENASSTEQILSTMRERVCLLLQPYEPQGLVADALSNEYASVFGEPMPCEAWKRLTGARIRPRDFIDLLQDLVRVIPGQAAGGSAGRHPKDRIVLNTHLGGQGEARVQPRPRPQDPQGTAQGQQGATARVAQGQEARQQQAAPLVQQQRNTEQPEQQPGPPSPCIGTPLFGFEEEGVDDLYDEAQRNAVSKRQGHGRANTKAVRAEHDFGSLLRYKEYVRQMVAHSKGRGMSVIKIQVSSCLTESRCVLP